MKRPEFFMPRKQRAVRYAGRCPARRPGGMPPWPPRPLSLLPYVPERSSPSRVHSATHKTRTSEGSGPFRRITEIRESGQMQSSLAALAGLPLVGIELFKQFGVDKTS